MGCFCRRTKKQGDGEDDLDVVDTSQPNAKAAAMSSAEKPSSPDRSSRRSLSRLFSGKKPMEQQQQSENDKSLTSEEEAAEAEEMHDSFVEGGPPPTMPAKAPSSFRPSQIESRVTERTNETDTSPGGMSSSYRRGSKYHPATAPPPLAQSAFHGPPRFDWIDIVSLKKRSAWDVNVVIVLTPMVCLISSQEYTAATKIQSIHRRNMVMSDMEQQGLSTSAIRNRRRRRKAVNRSYQNKVQQHDETPSLLNCCAAGLAFGALTEDDEQAYREHQRRQYEEKIQQQEAHEDLLRSEYLTSRGMKEPDEILKVLEDAE